MPSGYKKLIRILFDISSCKTFHKDLTDVFGFAKLFWLVSTHLFLKEPELDKFFEPTTTRMAGDERREQLCRIAMRLFSERGFRGTTTKEIANAAGVSEAVIFKHFSNKDELYAAILDNKACDHGMDNPFAEIADRIEQKDDFGVFYNMAL